jgi:hypothetical protein
MLYSKENATKDWIIHQKRSTHQLVISKSQLHSSWKCFSLKLETRNAGNLRRAWTNQQFSSSSSSSSASSSLSSLRSRFLWREFALENVIYKRKFNKRLNNSSKSDQLTNLSYPNHSYTLRESVFPSNLRRQTLEIFGELGQISRILGLHGKTNTTGETENFMT